MLFRTHPPAYIFLKRSQNPGFVCIARNRGAQSEGGNRGGRRVDQLELASADRPQPQAP
jgi:hypothetical protein